nr:immunoglobulin light chain junction region [Macaca mulatta]MOY13685.1 immunoglobulin light chain junction region [Macaca mulatta]
CLQGYSMPLTF